MATFSCRLEFPCVYFYESINHKIRFRMLIILYYTLYFSFKNDTYSILKQR